MLDANDKRYDIDDLVNSILMERQSSLPTDGFDVGTDDDADHEEVYLLEPIDETMLDDEVDSDEELPLLIDFEGFEEESVKVTAEVNQLAEEEFVARIVVPDDDVFAKQAAVETVPAIKPEPIASEPIKEVAPIEAVVAPVAAVSAAASTSVAAVENVVEAIPKKRKKLFGRKADDMTLEQSWADWGLKPIGHYRANETAPAPEPVKEEPQPKVMEAAVVPEVVDSVAVEEQMPSKRSANVDEFPAVASVSETITMQVVLPSGVALPRGEEHTRIVPTAKEEKAAVVTAVPPVQPSREEQLPDQLSLEEMVRVEDIDPVDSTVTNDDEMDPEKRLQLAREEKVREFTLDGSEEENNEPSEEPARIEEEKEIEDYTSYQDTETVAAELKYRCRTSLWSLVFTGLIQIVLLLLTLLTLKLDQPPMAPKAYVLTHLIGLGVMMVLNFSTLIRGLSGLFSLRANNDTAPALAASVGLADVLMHLMNLDAALPYWTPLVGLLLVFSAVGHYARELSVRRNFAFVSYSGDKYAAAVIEDENALQEIGRRAVSDGDATVAYFRRTGFLTNYLANAYDDDCGDDWSRWTTPVAVALSVLFSLLALLSEYVSGALGWMSVFTGMVCLSMPVTMLAVQLPLSRCSRQMLSQGGFLAGWKAVRRFGRPDALAVDIADLYPDESMRLHGIKTFSGTHIDEAIVTAASLVVRSGGPLSMIFRRIIENKEELLYDVDSLVYEQGMGLSGWVEGRRVFVGNGRLLQNHGVDVPSADFEARYAKNGRRLVYISIAGQLSAMFVVSYLPDPDIQAALQDLCRSRVTLLVRSCDPNITTSDLCESFELDEYYVDVLPASAGRMYVQLTEQPAESLPALVASNGHILGAARVLSACRSLQAKVRIALVVQTIIALAGLIFCLVWTMQNTLSLFQPLLLLFASWFLSWLFPLFRRT